MPGTSLSHYSKYSGSGLVYTTGTSYQVNNTTRTNNTSSTLTHDDLVYIGRALSVSVPPTYIDSGTTDRCEYIAGPEYITGPTNRNQFTIGADYSIYSPHVVYYCPSYISTINGGIVLGEEDKPKIFSGLSVHIKTRAAPVDKVSAQEQVALETLREMVTEKEYRKYLRYGFILVRGKSGDTYQIFRNNAHTKVWRGGKLVEEICVRIKDIKIPPTDNVIAFKVAVETSEESFKHSGNVYKFIKSAA